MTTQSHNHTHIRRATVAFMAALVLLLTTHTGSAFAAPAAQGKIVEVKDLPRDITIPNAGKAYRITYGTLGVKDAPALSSAAVYLPQGTPPKGGWPVIAWAHGTTGLNDACAYSIRGPAAVERDWEYLSTWIDQGYAVVASDYVGLGTPDNHPYLNGIVEAHSVVDAVKAAHTQFSALSGKWATIGQSQGGGAAMFVARYADDFGGSANGLSYRGAVATGVPAYIEDLLPGMFRPGVVPVELNRLRSLEIYELYIISGLRTTFPEWDIDSFLTDYGKEWLEVAESPLCETLPGSGQYGIGDALGEGDYVSGKVWVKPLDEIPGLEGYLKDYMGIPETGYTKPVFMAQGGLDTDVGPGAVALAERLKLNGEPITFKFYPTEDHSGTVNRSKEESIPFVADLFAD